MCYGERGRSILGVIDKIRKKVIDKEYEFTIPHFFEEMAADDLEFADIKRTIETGTISQKFTGCCPNRNPFERSLKRFCQQILAKWKISDVNCLSPKGEF